MNITNGTFEDNTSEEITYTIDRLYERYDHEKLPVPTPSMTPTATYTTTPTPSMTATYTTTPTPSMTPTATYTTTPTFTFTMTQIVVGFNEYNDEYVQMSVFIPGDKTLSGFAFDYGDAEYYNVSMVAQTVSPNTFMFEPSTLDDRIKRCAFITQYGVKDRVDVIFKYTTTPRQDKNTQEYAGSKIQGLHVKDFIAYDVNRQEIQYEIHDELVENSTL